MKPKILDFNYGKEAEYKKYLSGQIASHPLYGMIELEKQGYDVEHISMSTSYGIKGIWENTKLFLNHKSNIVFCSYIYIQPLLGIALLKHLGFCKNRHFIGVCHAGFHDDLKILDRCLSMFVFKIFDHIFFHSPKNMQEAICNSRIKKSKMSILHWGIDLNFLDRHHIQSKIGNYYISTGREQRDFMTLIHAFEKTSSILELYTNPVNYENHYDYLEEYVGKNNNINIHLVEKNQYIYIDFIRLVAQSYAVVIPLLINHCYYCLGQTSIVEALALGKPIIVTENEYHPIDVEKSGVGIKIKSDTPEEWAKAIKYLTLHKDEAEKMSNNASTLAMKMYNITCCANEIAQVIKLII